MERTSANLAKAGRAAGTVTQMMGNEHNTDILHKCSRMLSEYDNRAFSIFYEEDRENGLPSRKPTYDLLYEDAQSVAYAMHAWYPSETFGKQLGHTLKAIVDNLGWYETVLETAANLFYCVVKDHPFEDGNKRLAGALMGTYLEMNDVHKLPSAEVLFLLAISVALSPSSEKESMIAIISQAIWRANKQ